jgi:hypothetical protein
MPQEVFENMIFFPMVLMVNPEEKGNTRILQVGIWMPGRRPRPGRF